MRKKYRFDIKTMSADCEANYARLSRLMSCAGGNVLFDGSEANGILLNVDLAGLEPTQVELQVSDRSRYTTTVDVRVYVSCFGDSGCTNMSVRLYHDVNMAEVIACNKKRSKLASYQYPNDSMFQPDEKAQQNRFLAEWLGLCLSHGLCSNAPATVDGLFADSAPVTADLSPLAPSKATA